MQMARGRVDAAGLSRWGGATWPGPCIWGGADAVGGARPGATNPRAAHGQVASDSVSGRTRSAAIRHLQLHFEATDGPLGLRSLRSRNRRIPPRSVQPVSLLKCVLVSGVGRNNEGIPAAALMATYCVDALQRPAPLGPVMHQSQQSRTLILLLMERGSEAGASPGSRDLHFLPAACRDPPNESTKMLSASAGLWVSLFPEILRNALAEPV